MPAPDPADVSFPRWPDRSGRPDSRCGRGLSDSTSRDGQIDPAGPPADAVGGLSDSTVQFSAVGGLADGVGGLSDSTVQFPAVGGRADGVGGLSDSTVQFPAVGGRADVAGGLSDSTVQFPAVGGRADGVGGLSDSTVQFPAVGGPADAARKPLDMTMPLAMIGLPADATMPFVFVGRPRLPGSADVTDDRAEAELRSLTQSILAGLKPREREVIELSFRHAMDDDDLAIVLDVSWSRARALAARARDRLEASPVRAAYRAYQAGCVPGTGGVAGRLGWAADRTDVGSGQLACPGLPDLRPARMGRAAPGGVFPPAAVGPAPPGTSGAGTEPLYLPGEGCGGVSPAGRPARGMRYGSPGSRGPSGKLSWAGIRAHPGPAIAAVAVAVWVVAAVSVTMLTFPGSHVAYAQAPQPSTVHVKGVQASVGTSPGSPAAAPRVQWPPRNLARPSRPRPLGCPRPPRRSRANRRIRRRRSPRPRPRFDEVALAKAIEVGFALPIAFGVTLAYGVAFGVTIAYALAFVIPVADGLRQVSR